MTRRKWFFKVAISFKTRRKKLTHFQERRKRIFFSVLIAPLDVFLVVFTAWQKPIDFPCWPGLPHGGEGWDAANTSLPKPCCGLSRANVASSCFWGWLPASEWGKRPVALSAKRKGRIGIHDDIKGFLTTALLAETLTFQKNFKKPVETRFLLGNSWAVDLIYWAIQDKVAIWNHRYSREKNKGMHVDVHFIVIYKSEKLKVVIWKWRYDKLTYG